MANLEGVKVGDKVTVHWYGKMNVRRVQKVTKTSITDSEGYRWTYPYGKRWGSDRCSAFCEKWVPEHDVRIAEVERETHQKNMRQIVIRYEYFNLPEVVLERIYAILKDHESSQKNAGAETDAA